MPKQWKEISGVQRTEINFISAKHKYHLQEILRVSSCDAPKLRYCKI